mmetsp:Transcript_107738/g.343883  ORF Transcript_107738/g.343883 Transcript_107738/m.343883 type:complete len:286 (+) Transcript_107738:738-1595(+)
MSLGPVRGPCSGAQASAASAGLPRRAAAPRRAASAPRRSRPSGPPSGPSASSASRRRPGPRRGWAAPARSSATAAASAAIGPRPSTRRANPSAPPCWTIQWAREATRRSPSMTTAAPETASPLCCRHVIARRASRAAATRMLGLTAEPQRVWAPHVTTRRRTCGMLQALNCSTCRGLSTSSVCHCMMPWRTPWPHRVTRTARRNCRCAASTSPRPPSASAARTPACASRCRRRPRRTAPREASEGRPRWARRQARPPRRRPLQDSARIAARRRVRPNLGKWLSSS